MFNRFVLFMLDQIIKNTISKLRDKFKRVFYEHKKNIIHSR